MSAAQANALRKLTGGKKIVKSANVLQSWSFMDRLSAGAAQAAELAALQKRRAEASRPKSPVSVHK